MAIGAGQISSGGGAERIVARPNQRPIWDTALKVGQFAPDYFVGTWQAAADMGKGLVSVVRHPIITGKGLFHLAGKLLTDPGSTLLVIGRAFVDPMAEAIAAGHPGRAAGRFGFELATLFVSPGRVLAFSKASAAFVAAAKTGIDAGLAGPKALELARCSAALNLAEIQAARDAERLASLGHAVESEVMVDYAAHAQKVAEGTRDAGVMADHAAKINRVGDYAQRAAHSKLEERMAQIAKTRQVTVSGTTMSYEQFFAYTRRLLKWGGKSKLSGRVPPKVYAEVSAAKIARGATRKAERVLAGGQAKPSIWVAAARGLLRNPQLGAFLAPALGLVPDALGRMGTRPKPVPSDSMTEEQWGAIASQYNLEASAENVRSFLDEVSSYQDNALGPDTAKPAQIRQLQLLLNLAHFEVAPTGSWDAATSRAVVDFKKSQGLTQSYRLLNGELAVNEYADQTVMELLEQRVNGQVDSASNHAGAIVDAGAKVASKAARAGKQRQLH